MKFKNILFLLILQVIFITVQCWAWSGKVVGVDAGDTIEVMHDGKGEKVKLYGLDCPDLKQDFGQRAKEFTSQYVLGKIVEVEPVATDQYGRTAAIVYFNNNSLNEAIIKSGLAWAYKKYSARPQCAEWIFFELQARVDKLGLWSVPNPTPPWEFRHKNKVSNSSK